jgi:hypothetical protein
MKGERPERKEWPPAVGLLFTAAFVPALFWVMFGVLDGYAIGFTAFLLMLQLAVEYLPKLADRASLESAEGAARGADAPPAKKVTRLESVCGGVWILSIPFAPFLTWALTNAFDLDRSNWRLLLGARAVLCVVVPLVTVLPLLRYVRRGMAGLQILVLGIGTAFPVATGAAAAADFVAGPVWQDVTVDGVRDVDFRTAAGTNVNAPGALVDLGDGRTLTRSAGVALRGGPMRIFALRHTGRILDAS